MRARPLLGGPMLVGLELDGGTPVPRDEWVDRKVRDGNRDGRVLRAARRPSAEEVASAVLRARLAPVVLVTGGRDRDPTAEELAVLDRVVRRLRARGVWVGDCPSGVDAVVRGWASRTGTPLRVFAADERRACYLERLGVEVVRASDWSRDGRRAGPVRNARMVADAGGRALLVAWPGGQGTEDAVLRARRAHLPVVQVAVALRSPADLDGDLVAWASQWGAG